ncbi:MAG: IS110 family transposase [Kiritimatiellae bacterium]|nr:IS110 family transposase [Kiritimatiellia bacterium]
MVVESTFNWYWLVDGLMENGYDVHLANPAAVHQYDGLKCSDDDTDAFVLAELDRLKILPEAFIYPKKERPVRDMLRRRLLLVRQRTQHKLSLGSLFSRETGGKLSNAEIGKLSPASSKKMFDSEDNCMMANINLKMIKFLKEQIYSIEGVILKRVKLKPEFEVLLSTPGIGKILALTIMLETGSLTRFAKAGNYTSYCRCVKSKKISNGKKKGENNGKNGNKYLCWAYIEAANFMKRYCPEAKSWYQRKMQRTNKIVATKALASKLSKACYFMMKNQEDFDVKMLFG